MHDGTLILFYPIFIIFYAHYSIIRLNMGKRHCLSALYKMTKKQLYMILT